MLKPWNLLAVILLVPAVARGDELASGRRQQARQRREAEQSGPNGWPARRHAHMIAVLQGAGRALDGSTEDWMPRGRPRKNADVLLRSAEFIGWALGGLEREIVETRNRLVKFEMHLVQPFQLFWILAVLKECSIQYELIEPGEILGHAKLKIVYSVSTPIYSIRQEHDVDLDHFHRRETLIATAR